MADDQGWGQTGYYKHPILKTPNLDDMATNGLRFDRFYAAGPVCSPTRASVLTGRSHDRTGVLSHGYALHRQERTIARAMQKAGYATGHFGKWRLNGVRGPGVPVLDSDPHHPGNFGFDHWLTVTNFFDMNPVMSCMGKFEEFQGDSSEVIVAEALKFIEQKSSDGKPFFTVIWYGSPHSPWVASPKDQIKGEEAKSAHHHGELVAM
ncbi:MAG: sulfatase-like hydrolase/transferase, partial [Planctomycetota bacterium]